MVEIDGYSKSPTLYSIIDDELTLPLLYGKEASISFELSNRATSCFYANLIGDLSGDLIGDLFGDLELIRSFYCSTMSFVNGIRN